MQRIIELVLSILCVITSTVSVFNGNMDNERNLFSRDGRFAESVRRQRWTLRNLT